MSYTTSEALPMPAPAPQPVQRSRSGPNIVFVPDTATASIQPAVEVSHVVALQDEIAAIEKHIGELVIGIETNSHALAGHLESRRAAQAIECDIEDALAAEALGTITEREARKQVAGFEKEKELPPEVHKLNQAQAGLRRALTTAERQRDSLHARLKPMLAAFYRSEAEKVAHDYVAAVDQLKAAFYQLAVLSNLSQANGGGSWFMPGSELVSVPSVSLAACRQREQQGYLFMGGRSDMATYQQAYAGELSRLGELGIKGFLSDAERGMVIPKALAG